jgi:deazaflavin-dependent oxidoreductase (nitroreductase family)
MAKTYRLNVVGRLINGVFRLMTRFGLGASYRYILTVPGRKTGRLYSTPVDVIEVAGDRWLVAGYGPASWVRNARAAGEVTLSRSGRSETFAVEEGGPQTAIPVLRAYIDRIKVTRPYFDADSGSPDGAIAAELGRHAVLRLVPKVVRANAR